MADAHKNFAYSTVAVAPNPSTTGTSLTVATNQGSVFPATPFNAVVAPAGALPLSSTSEIVRVTSISTDTFTIVRSQEGTTAQAIAVGYQIFAGVTTKTLTDIETTVEYAANKGVANGYASLDSGTHVPLAQLSGITVAQLASGVARWNPRNFNGSGGTLADGDAANCVNGPFTLTLPAPASGKQVLVAAISNVSATSPVTITTPSGLINGAGAAAYGAGATSASSIVLGSFGSYVYLVCIDGTNWVVNGAQDTGWVNLTLPTNWTVPIATYAPAVRRIGDRVLLRGQAKNNTGTGGQLMPNVPASMVPSQAVQMTFTTSQPAVNSFGVFVDGTTNTTLSIPSGVTAYLDGLSYSLY